MKLLEKFKNVTQNLYSFEIYEMSLETIIQFDHLNSVKDFIDNVIPEMLTENFIPRTELRETTMTILNRRNG